MPHKRSSSDAAVESRSNVSSELPNLQPDNSTPRSSSNGNMRTNSGNLLPGNEASQTKDPPDTSRTDLTEDETPRLQFENNCCRLLLLSDKTPKSYRVAECCLSDVVLIHYKNDSSVLNDLLRDAVYKCEGKKVQSVAFMCHSQDAMIHLCSSVEKHFTQNPITIPEIKNFFLGIKELLTNSASSEDDEASIDTICEHRVDFLGMRLTPGLNMFIEDLGRFLQLNVGLSQDPGGCDIRLDKDSLTTNSAPAYVGQFYFDVEKLRALTMSVPQSMAGFEKIRLVGKGAYGAAVLYRKKDDDTLVILKEINMIDLSASERQLALNEVKILSMLDHPNIISYFDHFEEDGVLIIEMEYADGGTLAQMLSQRGTEEPMEEGDILVLFQQMVAALRHIHSHHILHRDFKTDNIFLTKEGTVKLGDFGISKMMTSTRRLASTVLGTPYYISPELCEGKEYNEKSDIWALGCVLYEMACGQRTFDGTNLPALVTKIMKGQFAPIKATFSQPFRVLIRDMLQRDPQYRPSSHELLYMRLPELMKNVISDNRSKRASGLSLKSDFEGSNDGVQKSGAQNRNPDSANARSLVFEFNLQTMRIEPVSFPFRVKIKQFSSSATHTVCVSSEMSVFTWGEGSKGQLGHESLESCAVPTEVESLRGKSIVRVGAGDGFSIFGCDNGILLTAGDGTRGCLGHGDWNNSSKAKLIENLLSVDIVSFDCGPTHVAAVSSEGVIYTWGVGADGRLGLNELHDKNIPTQVSAPVRLMNSEQLFMSPFNFQKAIPALNTEIGILVTFSTNDAEGFQIRKVFCGYDGTLFLADMGCVLACGNNAFNKLGLNNRQGFLMGMKNFISKIEVESSAVPVVVKCLAKHRVVSLFAGRHHTAVLVEQGQMYLLGSNSDGQLGIGSLKQKNSPALVKELEQEKAVSASCGETFTLILNSENQIYLMGTLPKPLSTSTPTTPFATNSEFLVPNNDSVSGHGLDNSLDNSFGSNSGDTNSASANGPQIINSILKPPRSPTAVRSNSKDGAAGDIAYLSQYSELVPLSNVPDEIGLAFHVLEPAVTQVLSASVITKFVLDSLPEQQGRPQSASALQTAANGKTSNAAAKPRKSVSSDMARYKTCICLLVSCGFLSNSVLIAVETNAPMPKRKTRRRRMRRQKETSPPGKMTSAEDGGERDEMMRGHHKRYSSAASSQDGEYTTEADTDEEEEISEAGNQTDHLQDTSTSTVPTWLKKELDDDFLPIPSSTGPDSCYSSDEEVVRPSKRPPPGVTTDGKRSQRSNKDSGTSSTGRNLSASDNSNEQRPKPGHEDSQKETATQPHNANSVYMSTSNSSADLMLSQNTPVTPERTSKTARSAVSRPNTGKISRSNAPSAINSQNTTAAKRAAATVAAYNGGNVNLTRPATSNSKHPKSSVSGSNGNGKEGKEQACKGQPASNSSSPGSVVANSSPNNVQGKPMAVVGPEQNRAREQQPALSVKSTNERKLEEELEVMKREREEMQRVIEQMRQQLATVPPAVSSSPNPSAGQSDSSPMEQALREELALMRSELRNQGRTLAENAAELSRMQEQIVHTTTASNEFANNQALQRKSTLRSCASETKSERGNEELNKSHSSNSRSAAERPKAKSSKVCSLS